MSLPNNISPPTPEEVAAASGISRQAGKDWQSYEQRSARIGATIGDKLSAYFAPPFAGLRVLDWGSALGGVAIWLANRYEMEMHAADVDPHSMAWLEKQSVGVRAWNLVPQKPFPFEDDYFSAIYGVSVFTHIPPEWVEFYLEELRRVAKPGGLVMMTFTGYYKVENDKTKRANDQLRPKSIEDVREAGVFYRSYPQENQSKMDFTKHGDYGLAAHSDEYIQETFGKYFDIVSIDEGAIAFQNIVAMKKR